MKIELDKPMFDFITMTTWDYPNYPWVLEAVKKQFGKADDGKFLQYDGQYMAGNSVFVGAGEIDDKFHGIVRVSGYRADKAKWLLRTTGEKYRATRVDFQITVACDRINMVNVGGIMRSLSRRKIGLIVSGERDGSIYIGSRKSSKLIRIYIKFLEGGKLALRFEVEYKGKRAEKLGRMTPFTESETRRFIAGVLINELESVMFTGIHEFDEPISRMRDICERLSEGFGLSPVIARTESDTMVWLESQVISAFNRLAFDHDTNMKRLGKFLERVNTTYHHAMIDKGQDY